ncbi:Na -driven multidrug efflux pump [Halorhabdus sp. SVX81]|nr:Na -driven multidrug efflux pump [Halorhabdus sp. SVX81]
MGRGDQLRRVIRAFPAGLARLGLVERRQATGTLDGPHQSYLWDPAIAVPMSTATKIVLGTVALSALAALTLVVNTALAG